MKVVKRIFSEELPFLCACPALIWQIFFLFFPFIVLALYSFFEYSYLGAEYKFSLVYYQEVFQSHYFKAIVNSTILAFIVMVLCFIVAYPIAFFLAIRVPKKYRTLLLFLLILPSWTSIVVQVYAWFFLLEKNGLFAQVLYKLGIISESYHLLNKYFSILVGMISTYLPFMVLPIYATLEKMDKKLLEASADLGANKFETFKRVVWPLSLPGVYAGLLLVFIPSFGEFAIPTLLGGSKFVFWGSVIVDRFLRSRDWQFGAALAILGVVIPALLIWLSYLIKALIIKFSSLKNTRVVTSDGLDGYKEPWM